MQSTLTALNNVPRLVIALLKKRSLLNILPLFFSPMLAH
jgi:hypothetical protein